MSTEQIYKKKKNESKFIFYSVQEIPQLRGVF